MSRATMAAVAPSMESGMADATSSPARQLPSMRKSTAMTSRPPSSRFLNTVSSVPMTSLLRS